MNDQNTTDAPSAGNESAQNIVALADELYGKHGGGGAEIGGAALPGTAGAAGAPPVDSALIGRVFAGTIRAIDSVLCRRLGHAAFRATGDKGFAGNIIEETKLTDEEAAQVGKLASVLAQKYSIAGAFAPEIALGVVIIGYGMRFNFALNRIEEQTKAAKRQEATP